MAGDIKTNRVQLGDSATATQNFVLQTNVDGTAKLARGNAGATTQDILTVGSNGVVKTPQNLVAFSAYITANQNLTNGSWTKINLNAEEYDTANVFDSSGTYRFQPTIPGYYVVSWQVELSATATSQAISAIFKNGSELKRGFDVVSGIYSTGGTAQCYLNGSTDYLELNAFCSQAALQAASGANRTYFQGVLLAAA